MAWAGLELISTNLGLDWSLIIVLIANLANIASYAKGAQLGFLMGMIINAITFIGFYLGGNQSYIYPLVLMFMHVIMLALSLYINPRAEGVV